QARIRQNPPIRRGTQARVPASRVSQLRNRFNRSTTTVPRRRSRIPVTLFRDRNLRIDILEALEAAVGDSDSDTRHILNLQRDFNENDYDMLLSLDENNRGQGASVNQINCLPESVVQSENLEESCAICLETPRIGETIRHLPCFHKFHKDCIDPWLGRQKSCPVCKSSIT
ncbi:E3 ubiquitin-protein ligase SDIR1, partial [Linum perenne]